MTSPLRRGYQPRPFFPLVEGMRQGESRLRQGCTGEGPSRAGASTTLPPPVCGKGKQLKGKGFSLRDDVVRVLYIKSRSNTWRL